MEKIVDIKPIGIESAVVYAPFDKAPAELQKNGYKIISLEDNAKLRIQQGKDAYISSNSNWTREGILYIPKEGNKLVRNSPILESAREATRAHKIGREFYPTKEQIASALTDSIDFPEKTIEIPTNRFDSEALPIWVFGGEQEAQAYGEFLREAGIKDMPVWVVDKDYVKKQNKPFARQMWFGGLGYGSVLGGGRFLVNGVSLRGVKNLEEKAKKQ